MAEIDLSKPQADLKDGEYIFTIKEANCDQNKGTIDILVTTINDDNEEVEHNEHYNLLNDDATTNQKVLGAFTRFVRSILSDPTITKVETDNLVGIRFFATVSHDTYESQKYPGTIRSFIRLSEFKPIPSDLPF